jgi:hypothetical protein
MPSTSDCRLGEQYGPLPFVIGVTGHRDLRPTDHPKLEEAVRSFFNSIREKYPHTPFTLLSPLAEGADRLVARVAVEFGAHLVVPLPMRRDLYEEDFTTAASRVEFGELLNQAGSFFVLPVVKGFSEEDLHNDVEARNYQYEQVGAYIAAHSQILVALWDGVCTDLIGGTSAVIKFQMKGVPERYAPQRSQLDAVEGAEVYHIATPCLKNPQPNGQAFSLTRLSPHVDPCDDDDEPLSPSGTTKEEGSIAEMYDRIYANIDKLNRDALEQSSRLSLELEQSRSSLFPNEETENLPLEFKSMRERFAVVDALAIYFQQQAKKTLNGLFVFAFLAAVLFDIYAHLEFEGWPLLHAMSLVLYASMTVIAYYLLYLPANRKDYQNKYQDYRALAEGMRVQFFWSLADLNLSVADHYLRKQRSELDWICSAVRVWNLAENHGGLSTATGPNQMETIELVHKYWVADQLDYFIRSAENDRNKLERSEPWIKRLFWAGVTLAGLLAIGLLLALLTELPWRESFLEYLDSPTNIHGGLIILMSIPLIGAALLHNYAEKRVWSEHARQYNRMGQLFSASDKLLRKMARTGAYKDAQKLIEELGKEALAENGDWVLLHRERPLEPPHA